MADVKLLPCRCGGKPVLYENAEHWFRVACPECASSTIWRSRGNAIAKWNAGNAPASVEPASTSPGVTAGASNAELARLLEIDADCALVAEREAHHRDVRQFSELADAQRRRAEAAESDARKMREALEPFAKIAGKTGEIDAGSLDAMMFRARAALKETDQ